MKLVTNKAEKTIKAIQEIAGGEAFHEGAADQLETLADFNRRLFFTKFLELLCDAGNQVAICIDNLDLAELTPLIRYLLTVPAGVTILAAHNTERSNNASWDLIRADIEASAGVVWTVQALDTPPSGPGLKLSSARRPMTSSLKT